MNNNPDCNITIKRQVYNHLKLEDPIITGSMKIKINKLSNEQIDQIVDYIEGICKSKIE